MRTLLSIIVISICFCSCYHTDKQTIETLVAVNQSLIQAKNTVEEGNQYTQALLEKNLANDGRMVKPYYDKAMQVIHLSDSIVRQLQILKIKLAKEVGGMINYSDDSIEYMENKDAVAKCNGILIDDGYAKSLKTTLSKYRKEIIGLFNWKDAEGRNYLLQRDTAFLKIGLLMCDYIDADGKSSSWEEHNFEHAPLVADIETLTRLQVDVRNCESNIIKYFNSNVTSSCSWGRDFRPLIIYFNRYFGGKMVASPEQLDSVNWISFTKPIEASFEIQFIEKGKPVVLSSNNCMLTPEMHNEMKRLSKGDKVIVQNVDVKAPDGSSIKFYGPTIFVE